MKFIQIFDLDGQTFRKNSIYFNPRRVLNRQTFFLVHSQTTVVCPGILDTPCGEAYALDVMILGQVVLKTRMRINVFYTIKIISKYYIHLEFIF